MVILGILFAPIQIGGSVAYVMISGNSMEPEFREGDLVLTRRSNQYSQEDRVVYHNPQVGYIFHRIVESGKDGFTLKGDNNDWLDSFHPGADQILGKFWLAVPGGGSVIQKLREPVYFTGFSLLIFIGIFSLVWFSKDGPQKKTAGKSRNPMDKQKPLSAGDTRQELLLFIGLLALIAVVFGIVAFTKPLVKVIDDELMYTHQGLFEYSAPDRSNLYDNDTIQTGEPIFLRLVCDVDLQFDYQITSPRLTNAEKTALKGSYEIKVQLSDIDGWKRSFQLVPETEFQGPGFSAEMPFDLCQIQRLIAEKEDKTETKNRWYSLLILPEVNLTGSIENKLLATSYQPVIEFQVDAMILRLPEGVEGLKLDQEGFIENQRVISNSMTLFGQEINVILARRIGGIVLGLCLAAAVLPAWSLYNDWRKSDISRIQVQYHPLLVDIQQGSPVTQDSQVIEVVSFSDLIKMAERYGAMILHESKGKFHRYSVQDEQTIYQYDIYVFEEKSLFSNIIEFKHSLLNALDEDQLELYYQPVFNLKKNTLVGLEAFLRWNHPEYGKLYPADFISHADDCGLLEKIDGWVFKKVCLQQNAWRDLKLGLVTLSINISPEAILSGDFIQVISEVVKDLGTDPGKLQIEINRSNQALQENILGDHLEQLSSLGFRVAIDNFATNSANQINQVFQLPIHSIKIDRTVIFSSLKDSTSLKMIKAIAAMAKTAQVEVVAQGVESAAHLELLKNQGFEFGQGFFLGTPMKAADVQAILKKGSRAQAKKDKSAKA